MGRPHALPILLFQAPPGPRAYVVILLFILKVVAKFLPIIKVVNVCECLGGGLGPGELCTSISRALVCGEEAHVLCFLADPGPTFTWAGCPTEEFWEHLFFLPLFHRAFGPMSQSPYLPRCCSQSLRANFVPELTLSFPSSVVGVVRSSVDTGKARGRAPPSSFSSTILHNDGSCLGCAPVSGLALFYGTLPATGGKGWVGVPLIYQKEQVQGGLNDLPLWGNGTQTQWSVLAS